jgi:hypothetical protein
MKPRRWARIEPTPKSGSFDRERATVEAACQAFIGEFLKPRFLPEIRPTEFNYPVDICGKWHGTKYRFVQRFRTGRLNPNVSEFDAPFARLEYVGPDRFNLSYHRHTGQWWCLYRGVSLAEALALMESQGHFHPI